MIFFLPETARKIVDNGSVCPSRLLQLPLDTSILAPWKREPGESETTILRRSRGRLPNPLKTLTILARKDNLVIISACGLLYVVYTCVNTSLAIIFVDVYGLNQWQAGLIYLPFGIGGIVSTTFSGPLINKAYERERSQQGLASDHVRGDDLDVFSIERARIKVIWIPLLITCASVLSFGWLLHYKQVRKSIQCLYVHTDDLKHISAPLIMQFVAGLCMQLDFSVIRSP
jgi:MFS family permease